MNKNQAKIIALLLVCFFFCKILFYFCTVGFCVSSLDNRTRQLEKWLNKRWEALPDNLNEYSTRGVSYKLNDSILLLECVWKATELNAEHTKNGEPKKQPESKFTDSSNTHQPKELFYTNALQLTKEDYFT